MKRYGFWWGLFAYPLKFASASSPMAPGLMGIEVECMGVGEARGVRSSASTDWEGEILDRREEEEADEVVEGKGETVGSVTHNWTIMRGSMGRRSAVQM